MSKDLTSTEGILTVLFTEAVVMVIFHGTPVGSILLGSFGLEHTLT